MTLTKAKGFWWGVLGCIAVVLVANLCFLAVRLGDNLLPRKAIALAFRDGFEQDYLRTLSYPRDLMQGGDQYTDHVTMQILIVGNTTLWTNALAPRILSAEVAAGDKNERVPQRGEELRDFVYQKLGTEHADTYTRFWHGQSTLLGLALMFFTVDGYRSFLLLLTLALIAGCAITAALKDRRLLLALAPLLLVSFFFCGQTHFGSLVSYGPAQVVFWLLAWVLVAYGERLTSLHLVMLATLAGALEAFVDMMISPPLAAAVFLGVSGTVMAMRAPRLLQALGSMLSQSAAWAFGFGGTYVAKLALTCAVLGWHAVVDPFFVQLRFRVGLVDPHARMPSELGWLGVFLENIRMLFVEMWHLGYTSTYSYDTSEWVRYLTTFGWIYAGWQLARACWKKRPQIAVIAGGGYLAASVFVLAWVAAFPEHTWRHLWIMGRSAAIWIAAGWGWALTTRVLLPKPVKATAMDSAANGDTVKVIDESAHGLPQPPDPRQGDVRDHG